MMILRRAGIKPISDRQKAREANLRRIRPTLLSRSQGRCELCGERPEVLEGHHAFNRSFLGPRWSDDPDVLTALCPQDHHDVTYADDAEKLAKRDLCRRQAIVRLARRAGVEARLEGVDLRAEALRLTEIIEAQEEPK